MGARPLAAAFVGLACLACDPPPQLATEAGPPRTTCLALESEPVLLATGKLPEAIAADATNVYWLEGHLDHPMLMGVARSGGAPFKVAVVTGYARGLVIDETNAYWTRFYDYEEPNPNHGIWTVRLSGGEPSLLAGNQVHPVSIAGDATALYWINQGTDAAMDLDGSIMRLTKGGGAPTTLQSNEPVPGYIAIDEEGVYWMTHVGWPGTETAVRRVPKSGGAATTLAAHPHIGPALADGDMAYFGVGGYDLFAVPTSGGEPTHLLESDQLTSLLMARGDCLYWITGDGIVRAPKSGGEPAMVVPGVSNFEASALIADDRMLYWALHSGEVFMASITGP